MDDFGACRGVAGHTTVCMDSLCLMLGLNREDLTGISMSVRAARQIGDLCTDANCKISSVACIWEVGWMAAMQSGT